MHIGRFIESADYLLIVAKKRGIQPEAKFPFDYAANLRSPFSGTEEVAYLARPFAQFLNPEICSAINFDSGTKSVRTWAMVRSVVPALDRSRHTAPRQNRINSLLKRP